MRLFLQCPLLGALVTVAVLCHGAKADSVEPEDSAVTSDRDGKLFFKFIVRSTTTSFAIVRATSTVPFTCFNSVNTATVCAGRRRRRRRRSLDNASENVPEAAKLSPVLQPSVQQGTDTDITLKKEDRLVITSWSTRRSTFTSVSTVTTFGSTVSLSLLCTLGGISAFPTC